MKVCGLCQFGVCGFVDAGNMWIRFSFQEGKDFVHYGHQYLKSEFRNYEHFVGVMGKFDPYTFFFKDPVEVDELTEEVAQKLSKKLWK